MPIINRISAFHPEMTAWRRDIHAQPELGYAEHRISGIVGVLRNGTGGRVPAHNTKYDFNDELLPIGASFFATFVEQELPRQAG